jgi:hypothetical protein
MRSQTSSIVNLAKGYRKGRPVGPYDQLARREKRSVVSPNHRIPTFEITIYLNPIEEFFAELKASIKRNWRWTLHAPAAQRFLAKVAHHGSRSRLLAEASSTFAGVCSMPLYNQGHDIHREVVSRSCNAVVTCVAVGVPRSAQLRLNHRERCRSKLTQSGCSSTTHVPLPLRTLLAKFGLGDLLIPQNSFH